MHPEGLLNTGEVFGLMVAGARFELWKRPLKFEARHAEAASGVILRA